MTNNNIGGGAMKITNINKRMSNLQDIINIQCSHGNWNYDPYMQGLANGLIMAKSIFTDETPEFMEAPKVWGKHYPTLITRLKWMFTGYPKPTTAIGVSNQKMEESK
jgi:hypothetical protein